MHCFSRHNRKTLLLTLSWLGSLLVSIHPAFAERFPIKSYGTPDGLGSSFIEAILQDSHGYLWVCTRDGLSRFDGYKFTTYKTSDGLPIPNVIDILENEDGTFWVATNGGGICRFDPAGKTRANSGNKSGELFTIYSLGSGDKQIRVDTLYRDNRGRIWVGTSHGLFRLDREKAETFTQVPLRPGSSSADRQPAIGGILQDRRGDIWISSSTSGLYRISKDERTARYTAQQHSAFTVTTDLLEDRQGHLWVGTGAGLCLIEANAETEELNVRCYTKKDGLADNVITCLLETRDGHLWIGTTSGLTEYDGTKFRSYDARNGLSGFHLTSMVEDRDGNLWIGTQSDGLMKFARNGFIAYGATDNESLNNIHNIFEDETGNLFVVSGDWFINQITSKEVSSARMNLPTDAKMSWLTNAVLRDRAGEFWAVTAGLGVFRFPEARDVTHLGRVKPKATYTTKSGMVSNYSRRAFEDSRGDIWFFGGGAASGLARWERANETFHRYTEADGAPASSDLTAFYEATDGDIWLGLAGGKIYRYREGRFSPFTEPNAPQRDSITALFVDSEKRLWIGDNQTGVVRIDNPTSDRPTPIKYGAAEGLSSDNARCIAEDRWGRIYVGTVRGVDRINPTTGKIKHYSSADGLSSDFTKFIYTDRQDNLWIATLNGVSKFTPEPPAETSPPAVVISGLRVAGEALPISELGEINIGNFEFTANRNQVQVDFTAPAFGLGETLRFQYKLEGADPGWNAPTDLRTVNYASLSPGSYRFVVQAINGEGIASERPAMVTFTILTPIWLRWWFITFAAAILAIPVLLIVRSRHQRKRAEQSLHLEKEERLRELEEVRRRIAKDLHDDVGSSLTQVSLLTEVARRAMNGANDFANEQLSIVAKMSRELVDSMSDIVWAVNPQKDTLDDLTHRMRRFASNVFTAQQIDFQFQTPDEDQDIKIGANMRREVFLIFKEGVNNIARHSGCGRADLQFRFESDRLILKMSDNGQGFDPSQESTGNGLMNMKDRARAFGGDCDLISKQGVGTELNVTIPLKQHS